jgi:hypothetical protein
MRGFGCCQVTFDQFFEGEEPIAEVVGLEEPVIARAFQCRVATSQQSSVFLPAHLIYGLPQQINDVEIILNDLRLRARFPHSTGVRGTRIHRDGLDRSVYVRWQRFQSYDRRRRRAVFQNLQNTPFRQIVEERTITVSFSEILLVDAQVWHLLQFAPGQMPPKPLPIPGNRQPLPILRTFLPSFHRHSHVNLPPSEIRLHVINLPAMRKPQHSMEKLLDVNPSAHRIHRHLQGEPCRLQKPLRTSSFRLRANRPFIIRLSLISFKLGLRKRPFS